MFFSNCFCILYLACRSQLFCENRTWVADSCNPFIILYIYQYRKEGKTCGSWKKASDSLCCSCCQLCDDMRRKTFCPSLSSVPTMGKQKEAQTFWSSCLVPQLFLEKLVSNSVRECESVCACTCVHVVFLLCEQKERVTGQITLLCSSADSVIFRKLLSV